MNSDRTDNLDDLAWIDRCADKFETAWNGPQRPRIQVYYAEARGSISRTSHARLIAELIKVDFEYRLKQGESARCEDYFNQFPQLQEAPDELVDDLIRELDRIQTRLHSSSEPGQRSSTQFDQVTISDPEPGELAHSDDITVGSDSSARGFEFESGCEIPQVMGRFRLLKRVGSGAFGIVYKAKDVQLNRVVAIKIPRMDRMANQQMTDRFLQEARAAAKMNHPGILKIFDITFYEGTPLLVSEFLEGTSLGEAFSSSREFSARETAELVLQIAEALHYAHRCGLIHRDIKPSNIFLTPESQPVILDFGIAHGEPLASLTATGQILGTPAYMSPEQASGQSNRVDARSDVYSLGVVLYEFLTGEQPFRGSPHRLIHQVLNEDPKSPTHYRSGIPVDLETICMKAMEKSPSMRYGSASEFADDLRRFLDNKPIQARPISSAGRLSRWCRRNPRVTVLSTVLLLGLMLTSIGATITSFIMSDLAGKERIARSEAQQKTTEAQLQTSRSFAESGIVKLRRGDALGLLDILASFEPVSDNPVELQSRQLLADRWVREFEGRLLALVSGPDSFQHAEFSPDGNVFATSCRDGTVQLWETSSGSAVGQPMRVMEDHHALGCRFSPDGTILASSERLINLVHWDLSDDSHVRTVFDRPGECVQFAFDEQHHLICTNRELLSGTTRFTIWNATTGDQLAQLSIPYDDTAIGVNQRGTQVAIAAAQFRVTPNSRRDPIMLILDLATGEKREIDIKPSFGRPEMIVFSPDESTIACGWSSDILAIYDESLEEQRILHHNEDIKDVVFSRNGEMIATASFDSYARVWYLDSERRPLEIKHDGPVLTLDFNHTGSWLATGGFDTVAHVWSTDTGELIDESFAHQNVITSVRFHPNRDLLLTASADRTVRIWKHKPPTDDLAQFVHPHRVWSVDFSADGKTLLTACEKTAVSFWDVVNQSPFREPIADSKDVVSARFNPVNPNQFVYCNLESILFYDLERGSDPIESFQGSFRASRYSSDGRFVVAGTDAESAWLFEIQDETVQGHTIPHPTKIHDVSIHPNNRWFATAGDDGYVRLWDVQTFEQITPPLAHQSFVEAISFSPDGELLATVSRNRSIYFWSTADWSPVGRMIPQVAAVQALAFSPDSRLLAAASSDGLIKLWDVRTGLMAGRPLEHDQWACCVDFSPSGHVLATGSFDKTARLWQIGLPNDASNVERLKARVWSALGAKKNKNGDVIALSADQWRDYRQRPPKATETPIKIVSPAASIN